MLDRRDDATERLLLDYSENINCKKEKKRRFSMAKSAFVRQNQPFFGKRNRPFYWGRCRRSPNNFGKTFDVIGSCNLMTGMSVVGDLFGREKMFLPRCKICESDEKSSGLSSTVYWSWERFCTKSQMVKYWWQR